MVYGESGAANAPYCCAFRDSSVSFAPPRNSFLCPSALLPLTTTYFKPPSPDARPPSSKLNIYIYLEYVAVPPIQIRLHQCTKHVLVN